MDKEEILKEIEKTKEHLTDLEQMLEKCEYKRWKPEPNEEYYYVNQVSEMTEDKNDEADIDVRRYKAYNCFRTKEQAKLEAEKILVRRQLEDIAKRLNKGVKIDWHNQTQIKYGISYNTDTNVIETYFASFNKSMGSTYCLDVNFKDIAIKEIGEERLLSYLRGE